MKLTIHQRLGRDDIGLGLVAVSGIEVQPAPAELATELAAFCERRREHPLSPREEALRAGSRDILRNGSYKPTGRGKPASEYLFRAASENAFPRINGPVDANNLVSIKHCVAISVFDLDLARGSEVEFRLGREGESYVFNPAGQTLELRDLVVGCVLDNGASRPIVTPIKDSLATKLTDASTRLCGAIYYPLAAGDAGHLQRATDEFLAWLLLCGQAVHGKAAVLAGQGTVSLELD